MFVGQGRVSESVITLKFDRFLSPQPEHTFIYYRLTQDQHDLLALYKHHGVDTSQITVIDDQSLLQQQNILVDVHEFGGWVYQQLLKLIALDACDATEIIIQDCDTFVIKPYTCFNNSDPVPLVIKNTSHSKEYYEYYTKFTGRTRTTSDCFVTEYMPITKSHWHTLKTTMENIHGSTWLLAMTDQFRRDSLTTPFLWFSEYELLGNWIRHCDPGLVTVPQIRLTVTDADFKYFSTHGNLPYDLSEYNSICCRPQTQFKIFDIDDIVMYKYTDYINSVI